MFFFLNEFYYLFFICLICFRFFKVYLKGLSPAGISCMPPDDYKERFQKKISQIIEHSLFIREVTGSWKGRRY